MSLGFLKKQNEFLQQILDIAHSIFIGLNNEGEIILANREAEEILGYAHSEIMGKNWFDNFLPLSEREIVSDVYTKIILGEIKSVEYFDNYVINKAGDKILIRWHNSILYDKKGGITGLLSSGIDLTEQKEAESKLEKSELLVQKIFDILPIGLWVADGDGKLLKGNPAGIKIWGAEPHVGIEEYGVFKAYRMPSHEEIKPEDWALAHTISKGVTVEDELLEIDAFDGKKKLILNYTAPVLDDENKVMGAVIVNRDVTEEKLLELSLIESEERFQLAMNASEDGIFDWNLITKEIYYSPRWKGMLGYQDDEIKNDFSVWEKLTQEEDVKTSWNILNELITGKRDRFEIEFKMKHKDGHWVDILSRANKVVDETGKAIRIVGTHVDISELKKYREHLEELVAQRTKDLEAKNEELQRYNKLFVGREFRIKELRDQMKVLKEELGKYR